MDELLTRQMPHSLEAEQAVIGSMLIDPSCIADMLEQIKPDDFYLQQNKDIFTTIYTMFNYSMDIDPVTVMDQMKQSAETSLNSAFSAFDRSLRDATSAFLASASSRRPS